LQKHTSSIKYFTSLTDQDKRAKEKKQNIGDINYTPVVRRLLEHGEIF